MTESGPSSTNLWRDMLTGIGQIFPPGVRGRASPDLAAAWRREADGLPSPEDEAKLEGARAWIFDALMRSVLGDKAEESGREERCARRPLRGGGAPRSSRPSLGASQLVMAAYMRGGQRRQVRLVVRNSETFAMCGASCDLAWPDAVAAWATVRTRLAAWLAMPAALCRGRLWQDHLVTRMLRKSRAPHIPESCNPGEPSLLRSRPKVANKLPRELRFG